MDPISRMLAGGVGGGGGDQTVYDTAEVINVSSLALLKMLKHGRAGVPLEVMGLMLGEVVDDYTITVTDVFAMPQSGTGVSVEAVDPVYQTDMMEMLERTNRTENSVGWYHSHPGFGCWLSGVDENTQSSFERLHSRSVALVIDPVQSVKGKVVIDAFRLINPQRRMAKKPARQTTSNLGHLRKPSPVALVHNLNRHYYSINISYRKHHLEQKMLLNLHKKIWTEGLRIKDPKEMAKSNEEKSKDLLSLATELRKRLADEQGKTQEELKTAHVGLLDPRKRLDALVEEANMENITQSLRLNLGLVAFSGVKPAGRAES